MPQLTKQDVADVVEEVLDRKLDEKLDKKLGLQAGQTLDDKLGLKPGENLGDKLGLKPGETLDSKLGLRPEETLDDKLDQKFGFFAEHMDNKLDSLAEAVSTINTTMHSLARQSDLEEVKADVKTIKLAVRATNDDLHRL